MKKIIIYGIACIELRRDIEHFLDNDYQIIGYSDAFCIDNGAQGVPFIKLCELYKQDFDHILLASYKETTWSDMRKSLIKYGICKEEFEKNFFDCSLPGLDLYYNVQIYKYIVKQMSISNIKMALMVFPYYYFDYDMSLSPYQYKTGQIFSVYRLNDWHNYQQVPDGINYVTNYKMFGKKIAQTYCSHWFGIEKTNSYSEKDGTAALDKIWFTEHKQTIIENRKLFAEFCLDLKARGIDPILVIPPFYLQGITPSSLKAFKEKKKLFYHIVETTANEVGDIKVYDYADKFAGNADYFRDITHLNANGRKSFTNLINETIFSK